MQFYKPMTTFLIKNRLDFFKLFDIIRKDFSDQKIRIVLEQKFLTPLDVLILAQFFIYQLTKNCEIDLDVKNADVLEYVKAIGLQDFCQKNHSESIEIIEINSFTAMPIKRLTRETMDYYINTTQSYFESICHGKDLGVLNIALAELINNVHDHAKSPIDSYVFCQYYPKTSEIILAVSDLGIGIPFSVNSFMQRNGKPLLKAEDTLKWALELKKTTQSMPYNAGKGLDTISSFMQTNQGNWRIYSDSIWMESDPEGNKFEENPVKCFIGTVIEVSINVANLNEKIIEDSFDWEF
jgi:hypothetical protein